MAGPRAIELTQAPPPQASPGEREVMLAEASDDDAPVDADLHRRTVLKLDCILLPFLALLFLFNALDKANVSDG